MFDVRTRSSCLFSTQSCLLSSARLSLGLAAFDSNYVRMSPALKPVRIVFSLFLFLYVFLKHGSFQFALTHRGSNRGDFVVAPGDHKVAAAATVFELPS